MNSYGTSLVENLRALYRSHGGPRSIFRSGYFWLSVCAALLTWRSALDESWASIAQSALPTLAGFSIASFAILFAILDAPARRALRAPSPQLGDRSPLLVLASSVTHAVVVQISTLIFSIVFVSKPLPALPGWELAASIVTLGVSALGLLLLLYAVVLVLAAVLSVFKILEIAV